MTVAMALVEVMSVQPGSDMRIVLQLSASAASAGKEMRMVAARARPKRRCVMAIPLFLVWAGYLDLQPASIKALYALYLQPLILNDCHRDSLCLIESLTSAG